MDGTDLDDSVDSIVASCNGDMRGALKALMLVNEQLERELSRVSAQASRSATHVVGSALH